MRITHVATSDQGGAAVAARRLHRGLRGLGHDSRMLVSIRRGDDRHTDQFDWSTDMLGKAKAWWEHRKLRQFSAELRAQLRPGSDQVTDVRIPNGRNIFRQLDADVINLHWVSWFVDWPSFFPEATQRWPVVWTLHDVNAFTGGCHYTEGCRRFEQQCGRCPLLNSQDEDDATREIWRLKQQAYQAIQAGRLRVVTPSRWLATEARCSRLMRDWPIEVIPYGLDLNVFKPVDQSAARRALGLPIDARIVLFVSESLNSPRKGAAQLSEALRGIGSIDRVCLLSVGSGQMADDKLPVINLGRIDGEQKLAEAYSAADVFALPSLEDNLPNTMLESVACGTPVAAFNAGGIPDFVRPGETGELAPVGDVKALADALSRLLTDDARRERMSENCRRVAEAELSMDTQADRYDQLYHQMQSPDPQACESA